MRTLDLDQFWPQAARLLDAAAVPPDGERAPAPSHGPESVSVLNQPIEVAETVAPPPAKPLDRSPLVWSGLGFVAGMITWHFIGFWSFVSNVVYTGEPVPQIVTGSISNAGNSADPAPGSLVVKADPAKCIVLEIDRALGEARPSACTAALEPLRDAGYRRRSDRAYARPRLQDPNIWAGTTAVETAAAVTEVAPASRDASLDISEFDLEIKPEPVN